MRQLTITNIDNIQYKQIPNTYKYISDIQYTQSYPTEKGILISASYVLNIKDYNDSTNVDVLTIKREILTTGSHPFDIEYFDASYRIDNKQTYRTSFLRYELESMDTLLDVIYMKMYLSNPTINYSPYVIPNYIP